MFITIDMLEKYGACDAGMKWFQRRFPNGGELIDIINHETATTDFLHWGYTHLSTTEEEKKAYWRKIKVDCKDIHTIYESDNVFDSQWISRSSSVIKSEYIFSSKDIESCSNVSLSENAQNSRLVFGSEFVYDSYCVVHGKNITDSHNVVYSDYVVNSHSVTNAIGVTNSAYVGGLVLGSTRQIKDSRFISDCTNVRHCLFCYGIQDAEYMLFNQPIDSSDYDLIVKQLNKILGKYDMELVRENNWPEFTIPLDSPQIQRNIIKQYAGLPEAFWRWVKTLPGYDPAVLYAITYSKELI